MGKLANPCAKDDIINRLSRSESSNQIANDYNVSGQRIRQIKKENQKLIDQKKQELIQLLPKVVDIVKKDLDTNYKISSGLNDNYEKATTESIALKNTLDKTNLNLLKIAGIIQPHTNLTNLGNITVNQQNVVNPSVIKLISNASLDQLDALEIVDNVENDDENSQDS
jgi:hypothetical protein